MTAIALRASPLILLLVPMASWFSADSIGAAEMTFVVNQPENLVSHGDGACDVTCTLRDAITAANSNPGHDTITFTGDGGDQTINPNPLPAINAGSGITIDGSGADVQIVGFESTPGAGLAFVSAPGETARDIIVRNVSVGYFTNGLVVCGGAVGADCGYDVASVQLDTVASSTNTEFAIRVQGAKVNNIEIREVTAEENGNTAVSVDALNAISNVTIDEGIVSAANYGINVYTSAAINNVTITDNAVANSATGINVYSPGLSVTDVTVARNSVSAAGGYGIIAFGNTSGTDLLIDQNTISGAGNDAVLAGSFDLTSDVHVEDNDINGGWGLDLSGIRGDGNIIRRNTITASAYAGITVPGTSLQATISRNSIYGNAGLGINLYVDGELPPGVTPNDPGDTDTGPNGLLNFPVLTGSDGHVVSGTACGNCLIELFISDNDPTGYGEGKQFISDVKANGAGSFGVPVCDENLNAGTKVTATATDQGGNTSEFSLNYTLPISSGECPVITPTPTPSATSTPAGPTPTPTPAPTPTATPLAELAQGDNQCDKDVDAVDALAGLRNSAGLAYQQDPGCPAIGSIVNVAAPASAIAVFGDVDCDTDVDAVDALKILQFVAGLPFLQNEPCPDLGTPLG